MKARAWSGASSWADAGAGAADAAASMANPSTAMRTPIDASPNFTVTNFAATLTKFLNGPLTIALGMLTQGRGRIVYGFTESSPQSGRALAPRRCAAPHR